MDAGQTLALGSAITGARTYIAFGGGIDVAPFLDSRATFVIGACGGLDGTALKEGTGHPAGVG